MKWDEVQLGEVLNYEQPTKYIVSSSDYNDDKTATPVLTAGKTFILGYTDEKQGIFQIKLPVIIFDDFTTATKFVDFPFKVKSSAIKILYADSSKADIRYLFYAMQNIVFPVIKHKRHWISEYSKIKIPLPPLDEQKRIANELDSIGLLREKTVGENRLAEKLSATISRRLFEKIDSKTTKKLNNICGIVKGSSPTLKTPAGEYPLVVTSEKRRSANTYQFDGEAVCIPIVSSTGHGHASLHRIHYQSGKFALANIVVAVSSKDESKVRTKYLYYYLSFYKDELLVPLMRGVANVTIPFSTIGELGVRVPSIAEQNKIVAVLDEVLSLKSILVNRNIMVEQLVKAALQRTFQPQESEAIIKATPVVSPIQLATPRMFDVQQAVAQILSRFERGEMVVAKMLYIGQTIYQVPLNIQFSAQNFGPYDTVVKKAVTAGLSPRNKFFTKKGFGNMQVLALGANSNNILKYSSSVIARKTNEYLDAMTSHFSASDSAAIERLATVCKIIEDEKTADEKVVKTKLQQWKPNKFQDVDVSRTLSFIKMNNWDAKLLK